MLIGFNTAIVAVAAQIVPTAVSYEAMAVRSSSCETQLLSLYKWTAMWDCVVMGRFSAGCVQGCCAGGYY